MSVGAMVKIPYSVVKNLYHKFVTDPQVDPMHILTQLQHAYWFYVDHMRPLPSEPPPSFAGFLYRLAPLLRWPSCEVKARLKAFWKFNASVPRAGGILLNAEQTKLVLVRGPGSNRWSFPVGKLGPQELERVCAEREVFEETGYQGVLSETARSFVYRKRKAVHTLFVFENVPEDYVFAPLSSQEIAEVRWFSFDALTEVLPSRLRQNLVDFLGVYVYPRCEPEVTQPSSSSSDTSPALLPACSQVTDGGMSTALELLSLEPFAPLAPWEESHSASSSCVRI